MAANKKYEDAAEQKRADLLESAGDKSSAQTALQNASYQKSQAVQDAEQQLAEYESTKPGAYTATYQARVDAMLDKILSREGFSYDFNADPLYQAYKDQYTHAGRMAMQDTMASQQAASGGYGSSYAASAGSQAYQGYLTQLNGRLPELYETALNTYQAEGAQMQNQLSDLTSQEKDARSAYEDTVADYYKGLSQYTSRADTTYKNDYAEYEHMVDSLTDLRDYYADQEQQQYNNEMSRKAYELAVQKYEENMREWQAEQASADARWQAQQAADKEKWQAQLAQNQSQFVQEMNYKQQTAAAKLASEAQKSSASAAKKSTGSSRKKSSSSTQKASDSKAKANFQQSSTKMGAHTL